MSKLTAGFARVDITPPLGIYISGYYEPRNAAGILDPLFANALAVGDSHTSALILALDVIGINQSVLDNMRKDIAVSCGLDEENIFVTCSHTHTGPEIGGGLFPNNQAYNTRLTYLLAQAASLALDDRRPAVLSAASGYAPGISFIRRFVMRDGSIRTNPGRRNPEIEHPVGEPDESLGLIRIIRENAAEILLTNFAVHPDVIGGSMLSADYIGFVRRTLEGALPGVHVIHLNGAAGNLNHINVNCPEWDVNGGYAHSAHMGRVIAGAALSIYTKARPITSDRIDPSMITISAAANKGDPANLPLAHNYVEWHKTGRDDLIPEHGMGIITLVAEATRMLKLADAPDDIKLHLSALRIGGLCIAGLPGEAFTEIGKVIKKESPFESQFVCGIMNGYEGYFPMRDSFEEGGYEARSSNFCAGIGEMLAEESVSLIKSLASKN